MSRPTVSVCLFCQINSNLILLVTRPPNTTSEDFTVKCFTYELVSNNAELKKPTKYLLNKILKLRCVKPFVGPSPDFFVVRLVHLSDYLMLLLD